MTTQRKHAFSRWRHGGWYVHTVRYPSGACGCVSNNYADHKWRIVCDDRRIGIDLGAPGDFTFPTRNAAADAEQQLIDQGELSDFEKRQAEKVAA